MKPEFVHVGFGNVVAANRILAVVGPSSSPVKRMVHEATARQMIIDMTSGRKTKSVIVLDTGHIVLAALQPQTITGRLNGPAETEIQETEIQDA
jgi:hypothetical protein